MLVDDALALFLADNTATSVAHRQMRVSVLMPGQAFPRVGVVYGDGGVAVRNVVSWGDDVHQNVSAPV